MNSEINLLVEALQTNGEAEGNGVKYIYMDDSTVYRFENNRMKKVSATMIKKANKVIASGSTPPYDGSAQPPAKKTTRKTTKAKQPEPQPEPEQQAEEEDDEEEPAPPPPPKAKKTTAKKTTKKATTPDASTIDLNEYYNNKNRMEFMQAEMDRLQTKVNKLKQYKTLMNKITGGEYDIQPVQPMYEEQPPQQMQQQAQPMYTRGGRKINDDLFSFN